MIRRGLPAFVFALALWSLLPATARADTLHPALYAIEVNGVRASDGSVVFTDAAGVVYARIDDLRAWRIVVPAGLRSIERDGVRFVALRDLPGVRVVADAAQQVLDLRAGATALQASRFDVQDRSLLDVAPPAGAFLNYALSAGGGSGGSAVAADLVSGIALAGGVVRNTLTWTPGTLSRIDTNWERDDARHLRRLVLGDATTYDARMLSSLRFAGVQISSDFNQQPYLRTYPGVDVRGSATVPSALDIYVNDVLALRRDVPAGPYALRDLPVFEGAGTIDIRARDAFGATSGLRVPYYVARQLLAPGLHEFEYSAGFLDEGGRYGPAFAAATQRWGLSDRLSLGGLLQAGAARTIAGVNADVLAGRAGVVSAGAAVSAGGGSHGTFATAAYDYTSRLFSLGANIRTATDGFHTLDTTALALGRQVSAHASVRFARTQLIDVSLVRDSSFAGPVSIASIGFAGNTRGVPFSLTAHRSSGAGSSEAGIGGVWTIPLGRHAFVSQHTGAGSDAAQSAVTFSGARTDAASALQWDVQAATARGATSSASLVASTTTTDIGFDAFAQNGFSRVSARVQGGLAALGGKIAPTREVSGAFALVRVPGIAGIPIYINDRFAGVTDRRGELLAAGLVPFVENTVRLDGGAFALTQHADVLMQTVVPSAGAGTTVTFAIASEREALATLQLPDGTPLAAGTLVYSADRLRSWPVGFDGAVDLLGVARGPLVLFSGQGPDACTFRMDVPDGNGISRLGAVRCDRDRVPLRLPAAP